ncbi:MAG TPA: hypothetical protein VFK13_03675 [Gemmatimonadaceae bacterium]|nr:hypothetical protein [Gemmatimonadaceae bacterium]
MIAAIAAGITLAGCERGNTPPPVDSTRTVPPPPAESVAVPPAVSWGVRLGKVLVVAGGDSAAVSVVLPARLSLEDTISVDTRALDGTAVDLFAPTGLVGHGRLADVSISAEGPRCPDWPSGLVAPEGITGALPSWTFGLPANRAHPIPMQPLESLPQSDSARLAAELTRIASVLSTDSVFRGIPFVVRVAYRFTPVTGKTAVVAELTRRLPQEAAPQEEHLLLVAERDSTAQRFGPAYWSRSSGSETEVTGTEILGAVNLPSVGHPILLLDAVHYEGDVYVVLERTEQGWTRRWESPYAGC